MGVFISPAQTSITTTTAAGTNIPVTLTAGGTAQVWYSEPFTDAVTISGTVTANIWGAESANTVNSGVGILIERTNNAGTVQSSIVAVTGIPATITEWPLRAASVAKNGTYTPTSTSMAIGERIKITISHRAAGGTMAAGQADIYYGGNADLGTVGDSYVQFTEDFRTDQINEGLHYYAVSSVGGYYGG
jgi:hypothetical protein